MEIEVKKDLNLQEKKTGKHGLIFFCKQLFFHLRQYYLLSIPLVFFTMVAASYTAIVPLITKIIFDEALAYKNFHLFLILLSMLIAGLLLYVISSVASNILQTSLGVKISNDLRLSMFRKIHYLSHANYRMNVPGNLLHRFGENLGMLTYVLTQVLWSFIGRLMFVAAAIGILIYLNWKMSLLIFLIMPAFFFTANKIAALAERQFGVKESEEAGLFNLAREDIDFHSTVNLLRLKKYRIQQFGQKLGEFEKKSFLYNLFIVLTNTTVSTSMVFSRLLIIALGSYWVFKGYLSLGSFFGFLTLYGAFSSATSALAESYPALIQGANGLARIKELLDFPVNKEQEKRLPDLARLTKKIQFHDVGFEYSRDQDALKNINMEILAGETVGIIGASGSGKSTLLSLLLRQEVPSAGCIEFDGKNIWDHSADSLLSQMGVVSRNPGLFLMSICDNIRMGKLDATDEEVADAAKAAEIHDEISALPDGYHTLITWGGENLSAGQMQRIILARALVCNPAILVLDEATSALDIYNQEAVRMTLRQQINDRTTIMVTHHLKEVMDLEKIILFDKGKIVETGSHESLLQAKGKYYELWEKQTGVDISPDRKSAKIKLDWLRKIPLFEKFDNETLNFCVEKFMIEEMPPGHIVFEENTIGKKFYIIVTGSVVISKQIENDQQKDIAILENGDYFGEIALLYSVPRTARVTTQENCSFLVLHQDQFSAVIDKLPAQAREEFQQIAHNRLGSQ